MRVGDKVEIVKDDPWTGGIGNIVAIVFHGKKKQFIVQFKGQYKKSYDWSYFYAKNMRRFK